MYVLDPENVRTSFGNVRTGFGIVRCTYRIQNCTYIEYIEGPDPIRTTTSPDPIRTVLDPIRTIPNPIRTIPNSIRTILNPLRTHSCKCAVGGVWVNTSTPLTPQCVKRRYGFGLSVRC